MPESQLRVRVFDGSRAEFGNNIPVLMTIMDGNNKVVFRDERPSGTTFAVEFFDNAGDNYTVVAYRDGYEQAGLCLSNAILKCPKRLI